MSTPLRSQTASPPDAENPSRERGLLIGLLLFLLFIRIIYIFKMRMNSDEAQHLHVVWAWAHGLLPYRDVFDNHTPLFHLACAPLFALFGETARIVIYMRLSMLVCFCATLWITAKIGESLYSVTVGRWAAVILGFLPLFFLKTIEFRTDDLWAVAWLATMAFLVGGKLTVRRSFFAGLLMGSTFGVSMKTTLLALALILGGIVWITLRYLKGEKPWPPGTMKLFGSAFAGLLVVPAAIVGFFTLHGAIQHLYYGTILHNLVPQSGSGSRLSVRLLWFPLTFPLLVWTAGRKMLHRGSEGMAKDRWVLILLATGFYFGLLKSYWPMVTAQDFLPVIPLAVVLVTPAVLAVAGKLPQRYPQVSALALPVALVSLELVETVREVKPHSRLVGDLEYFGHVLHMTDPGDYVMDAKCGAIFRRRPFYYALENITLAKMRTNSIKDNIVDRLIETRTCMSSVDRLVGKDLAFVEANYLPFDGKMRVAGQYLHPDATSGRAAFEISIAASYSVVTPKGLAAGFLDGRSVSEEMYLEVGPHEFVCNRPAVPSALVWAKATQRGFRPNFELDPLLAVASKAH